MLRRAVTLPADIETVWEALTAPGEMESWFGARVEWDLRPGGGARFDGIDGERVGTVEEVDTGRALRFVWWPAADEADRSEVAYRLEPDGDATTLTVTEERIGVPGQPDGEVVDRAGPVATGVACAGCWSPADDVALRVWAGTRFARSPVC